MASFILFFTSGFGLFLKKLLTSSSVNFLDALARRCDRWITLEEHGLIGGLGSAVLEWLAGTRHTVQLTRIGIPDVFIHEIGDQTFVRSSLGLDASSIHSAIKEAIA